MQAKPIFLPVSTFYFCFLASFLLLPALGRAAVAQENLAAEATGSDLTLRLGANHWEVKEELGFSSGTGNGTSMDLNPSVQYFFADKLSIGGTLEIFKAGSSRSVGLGPALTYYFYTHGRLATYIGQRFMFRFAAPKEWSPEDRRGGTTYLGFNYFSSPKVAIGGMLAANYGLDAPSSLQPYSVGRFIVTFYY